MSTGTLTSRYNIHTLIPTMSIISMSILFRGKATSPILTPMRMVGYAIVMLTFRTFIIGMGTRHETQGFQGTDV